LKIAIILNGHVPSQWAHSINTVKHANAFLKLGYEVELLVVERYQEAKHRKRISNIYDWYGVDEIPIIYFKDNPLAYFIEHDLLKWPIKTLNRLSGKKLLKWRDPEAKIIDYVKQKKFDICYCRTFRAVQYALDANLPVILETHNPDPSNNKELSGLLRRADHFSFKRIITIHDILKDKYILGGAPADKIQVLDDAVDLDLYNERHVDIENNREKLGLASQKKIILYCGSLKKGKGISQIIKTAKIMASNENIEFVVLGGNGKEVRAWKAVAAHVELANISFKGFVPGVLVPKYLGVADVLFMPFDLEGKNFVMDIKSTSPIKLFEYMASGVPIVSTDIPVVSRILKNKREALLVTPEKQNYSDAIELLLKDQEYSNYIGANAKAKVADYTYINRCKRILENINH
jgi:glycosyltransferase involved in cell wall biosynthesis